MLPVALPHTTRAAVARRTDGRLALASLQGDGEVVELGLADLARADPPAGPATRRASSHGLRRPAAGGVSVLVDSDVPVGAGLSSSAALTCSVALALRDLRRAGADPRPTSWTWPAGRRTTSSGAPTGILDQSASLLCTAGHALFLDTREQRTEQVPLDLAAAGLELLVVDTGTSHTHADGGYGDRRRECEEAAAAAGRRRRCATSPTSPAWRPSTTTVLLPPGPAHRHRERPGARGGADPARQDADPREIGPVLVAGHASLRDDFQISTPELDATVEAAVAAGAHGARMVGGGFGGSAVVLVDRDRAGAVADAVRARFDREGFAAPRTFDVVPSDGRPPARLTGSPAHTDEEHGVEATA